MEGWGAIFRVRALQSGRYCSVSNDLQFLWSEWETHISTKSTRQKCSRRDGPSHSTDRPLSEPNNSNGDGTCLRVRPSPGPALDTTPVGGYCLLAFTRHLDPLPRNDHLPQTVFLPEQFFPILCWLMFIRVLDPYIFRSLSRTAFRP